MSTQIAPVLAVNATGVTVASAPVYTTTRALRVFDCTAFCTVRDQAGQADSLTLTGAGLITTMATTNPPVLNNIYRLGTTATDRCDDANMLVAAGGTLTFTQTVGAGLTNAYDVTAYCYPL